MQVSPHVRTYGRKIPEAPPPYGCHRTHRRYLSPPPSVFGITIIGATVKVPPAAALFAACYVGYLYQCRYVLCYSMYLRQSSLSLSASFHGRNNARAYRLQTPHTHTHTRNISGKKNTKEIDPYHRAHPPYTDSNNKLEEEFESKQHSSPSLANYRTYTASLSLQQLVLATSSPARVYYPLGQQRDFPVTYPGPWAT